ncbi:MAG: M1 family aminopeptidase [Bacteroidota bacterium]
MIKRFLILSIAIVAFFSCFAQDNGAAICSKRKSMGSFSPTAKSINTPKHSFDVIHYNLEIDLYHCYTSPYPKSFSASNKITLKADSVMSTMTLNAVNTSLRIDSIKPSTVTFSHTNDLLQINLNQTYQVGDTVRLTIYYKHNDVADNAFYSNNGFVFTDNEPIGARKWIPCWDWPADKATFEVKAKVPSTVLLASNGRLQDSLKISDTIYYHWVSRDPMSTYLMLLTSKDGFNLKVTYWHPPLHPQDSVPMRFYYNAGENPQSVIDIMSPMADFFSNTFVEHPFEKNGFATLSSEFAWGGMENQTLTSLCPNCWQEMLAVHEFAHQWFGDMITCATWADIWINEGFATYSEALWLEHTQGAQAYRDEINGDASYYLLNNPGWAISNPAWAITTPDVNTLFNYAITYQKGACVIHQLRYVMGDTAFFNGMKNYTNDASNFKLNNTTIPDFFTKMQQSSGQDLSWFMNQWIYNPNHPLYTIQTILGGTQVYTTIGETNTPYFKMPVELKYIFFDNSDTIVKVMNDVNNQQFTFNFAKQVTSFQFDPNNEIVLKQVQSNTTLINTIEDILGFDVYPNPASENVNIAIRTYSPTEKEISVFNNLGQQVYHKTITADIRIMSLPLTKLSAGVYTIKLSNSTSSVIKPLVITK